jgi:hypothetical protein
MEIGKISWGRHIKIVQIMFSPQALFVCFFLFLSQGLSMIPRLAWNL